MTTALDLNAVGDYASTPDPPIALHEFYRTGTQAAAAPPPAVKFDTENVLQVSIRFVMDDYTPSVNLALIDQYWAAADTSYKLALLPTGAPHLIWSNGTAFVQRTGPALLQSVVADGQPVSLRATLTCNDGSGNNVVAFEYSLADPPAWQPLGAPIVTAGTTSGNPNSNRNITIANQPGSPQSAVIRVRWAKATCDGVTQFDVDFRAKPLGTAPVTDAVGNVFALNGGAAIVESALLTPSVPYGLRTDATGDYAATGDVAHAANANVYEFRAWAALDRWAPAGGITQQLLLKWDAPTNAREYYFYILPAGNISLNWSTTGSNFTGNVASSVAVPFTNGQKGWVRAVLDLKGGTADPTVTFYTSTDDSPTPTTWTQLGTVVTKTGFQGYIADKGAPLSVSNPTGNGPVGKIYAARVIVDGVTTTSPDFYLRETNAPFTDTQGNVWTLYGGAKVSGAPAGALDLRAWVALDDATPAAANALIAQWGGASKSYILQVLSAPPSSANLLLRFTYQTAAGAAVSVDSTAPIPASDGQRIHLRAVAVPADGHLRNTVTFYYSTEPVATPSAWTQLGAVVTGATIYTLNNATAQVRIGNREDTGTSQTFGQVYGVEVYMNGAAVANPDFRTMTPGQTVLTDTAGRTWTLAGAAVVIQVPGAPLTRRRRRHGRLAA